MRPHEFSEKVSELAARREPFAMATVTRAEGSTLAKPGFKILIDHEGRIVAGTFGGGCPEGPIVELARRAMEDGANRVVRIHLVDAAGSVAGMATAPSEDEIYVETDCGGTLEVHVEPMLPAERLVIVGQGGKDDIEEMLVRFAKALEFEVWVVDPNPHLADRPDHLVTAALPDPPVLHLGSRDSVVLLTKGERDAEVLARLLPEPVRYLGMLASRHRRDKALEELAARGVPAELRGKLRSPIGLDIGAKHPAEIALAILAEVVATKYHKSPGAPPAGPAPSHAPG